MSCSFFLKDYPASLIWTLLQRDTAVSPGTLLCSEAPMPTGRDSCVSPGTGSKDGALSLLHTGVLGSALPAARLVVHASSAAGPALALVGRLC